MLFSGVLCINFVGLIRRVSTICIKRCIGKTGLLHDERSAHSIQVARAGMGMNGPSPCSTTTTKTATVFLTRVSKLEPHLVRNHHTHHSARYAAPSRAHARETLQHFTLLLPFHALCCIGAGVGRAGRVMMRFMDTNADGRIDKDEWRDPCKLGLQVRNHSIGPSTSGHNELVHDLTISLCARVRTCLHDLMHCNDVWAGRHWTPTARTAAL